MLSANYWVWAQASIFASKYFFQKTIFAKCLLEGFMFLIFFSLHFTRFLFAISQSNFFKLEDEDISDEIGYCIDQQIKFSKKFDLKKKSSLQICLEFPSLDSFSEEDADFDLNWNESSNKQFTFQESMK
ncbi:hypothetical protein HK096_010617, partial [Nowakowskiella sp. JEL0078]